MEIERKWFLPKATFDDFAEQYKTNEADAIHYFVTQFYVSQNPEVRLGRGENLDGSIRYTRMTIKGEGQLSRFEEMIDVTRTVYNHLYESVRPMNIINKSYWKVPIVVENQLLFAEFSIVDGQWGYVEIEFPYEETALAFKPPKDWCEATYFNCFKMKQYAKNKKLYTLRRKALLTLHKIQQKLNLL